MHQYPTTRPTEPAVTISIVDAMVVVHTNGRFDLDSTETVVSAVAAAVRSGAVAMINLDTRDGGRPSTGCDPSGHLDGLGSPTVDPSTVSVLAPGYVGVISQTKCWTIDLTRQRLCCSAAPVDPRFVGAGAWTGIRALWATQAKITVLTTKDTYLSIAAGWTSTIPYKQGSLRSIDMASSGLGGSSDFAAATATDRRVVI